MENLTCGKLIGIAYRERRGSPMQRLDHACISVNSGIEGDFRGKPGKRQVTILTAESWNIACNELGVTLSWLTRRANLLVEGVSFNRSDVGRVICIGGAKLKITRETDPCRRMDLAYKGLKKALLPEWRGGVCCRVIEGAEVSVGDEVILPCPGRDLKALKGIRGTE